MIIAVNTRFVLKDQLEGYGYFTLEIFRILARNYPQHQFYFIFDRPVDPSFQFSSNVTPVVLTPQARHPVLWKIWYDVQIPRLLKKIRADVFVSPDGICSLVTKIPQCLVVHDIGIIHFPADYKRIHYLYFRRYMPRFLQKATTIATVSQFSKNDILKKYACDPAKIDIVYSAAKKIFHSVDPALQDAVRQKWTAGAAYFIYVGAIHPRKNLVNLLKAFSVFKKRQQTNMKLVLLGRMTWKNEAFVQLLKTYKYRSDVVLTGYVEEGELVKLTGAAYALIYPSTFEGFGVPVLEAMKCEIPALTSSNSSMQEIAGEAGLYFNPADVKDMADKMMLIYKDEDLRRKLIEKGRSVSSNYSWERTADLLWESIMKATGDRSA